MRAKKLQVGIFGVGAIGSILGCVLLENKDLQMHFFNRSPKDTLRVWRNESLREYPIHCSEAETITEILDYYDQRASISSCAFSIEKTYW